MEQSWPTPPVCPRHRSLGDLVLDIGHLISWNSCQLLYLHKTNMIFTSCPTKEMGDGICTLGQMELPGLSLTFLYRKLINDQMSGKPITE